MTRQNNRQLKQLDLLFQNKIDLEYQLLNQTTRKEVIELLELLLSEYLSRRVERKEVSDDQDQR